MEKERLISMSSHYEKSVELMMRLHVLMSEGQDGERGDKIRDEMDVHWYRLTEQEQEDLGKLSHELYQEEEKLKAAAKNTEKKEQ